MVGSNIGSTYNVVLTVQGIGFTSSCNNGG